MMRKDIIFNFKFGWIGLLVIVQLILLTSTSFAQNRTISGVVRDAESNQVLSSVNVVVRGTSSGTSTDSNGAYELTVSSLQDTLVFSYIGYQTKLVPINGRTTIDVRLKPQAILGEELIVVGFTSQKKSQITGAVSSIEGEAIEKTPVANVTQSIAGHVAGVVMNQQGGQPGENNPNIFIRGVGTLGNSDPLIVINGIVRENIGTVNPNSIESITVLKDAAAVAIYGMGGANGVILITTKNGHAGEARLSFSSYYGIQKPTYVAQTLTAQDYMRLKQEAYFSANPEGQSPPYTKEFINNYEQLNSKSPNKYPITNNAVKKYSDFTTPIQEYNFELSGGSENIQYYVQAGIFDQQGMYEQIEYKRYNYNVRLDLQVTPTTDVTTSIIGAVEKVNGEDAATDFAQLFRAGYKYIPTLNMYYTNGKWGQSAGNSPVGMLNSGGYTHEKTNTLFTKVSIIQEFPSVQGLSIEGVFSYDTNFRTFRGWHRPFYFWSLDTSTEPFTYTKKISTAEGGAPTYTYLQEDMVKQQEFTYQGQIKYERTFGNHEINTLFVMSARNFTYHNFSARRDEYTVPIDELNAGSSNKSNFYNSGLTNTGSQIGFVYRLAYSYKDKYLLQISGRYDGHYYFAPENRWGFFPAFSVGWVLSEEDFIRDNFDFVDYLKVRASWGKSGNLAGDPYQYVRGYTLYGNAYAYGNSKMVQGTYIEQEPNLNITWEVATKIDIGIEASMWNGLLSVEADYFHGKRTNMLLPPSVTVPVAYGLELAPENAGVMAKHGFEIVMSSTINELANDLQLNFRGTFTYAKNEMKEIFETDATYNNPRRRRTGRSYMTPFGYHALGLFSTEDDKNGDGIINSEDGYNVEQFGTLHPGDIQYADLNEDGVINAEDKTVIGYPPYPSITFGFMASAQWKGFDLNLFFQGSAMTSIDIRGFATIPFNNNNSNATYEYYNNRWTPQNQDARYPRATPAPYANNTRDSDFWFVNTSYMRLKTASLGYTIPASLTQKLNIESLRVYVMGQNLFTWSNIDFMDPAVSREATTEPDDDVDLATAYPVQKVYSVGINITF